MVSDSLSLPLPMWFTLLLLALPLLLSFLKAKKTKRPPGPMKFPIVGNMLHLLGGVPHQTLYKLSKKYGPIMHLQLGGVPIVVVSSPQLAEKVLKTFEANCCVRPPFMGAQRITYNYCELGFSPYNDFYKEIKKICSIELFSAQRVQTFRSIREEEVGLFVDSISQSCTSETPVDLSEKLMSYTANMICKIAFGKSIRERGLNDFNYQVIHDAIQMLEIVAASDFFPYFGWIMDKFIRRLDSKYEKVFRELDAFCQSLIDERIKDKNQTQEHEDIVDVLLKIQRNEAGSHSLKLTDEHLKALFVDIFLGGVESTATTMIWAMTELVRNPIAMKKTQQEIANCVGKTGRVSQSDVDKLHYLKAVVKESLRLHPPGTLIPREVINHFKLEGYDIYPHSHVQVNNWALGRDPNSWERPDDFVPERFINSSIDFKGQNFEYLPFGSGRRMCPGLHMATNNIEITLANLLHNFDWKLPAGMRAEDIDMEEKFGVLSQKKVPLKLVPVKKI